VETDKRIMIVSKNWCGGVPRLQEPEFAVLFTHTPTSVGVFGPLDPPAPDHREGGQAIPQ